MLKFDEYLMKSKSAARVTRTGTQGIHGSPKHLRSFPIDKPDEAPNRTAGGGAGRDRTDDLRLAKAALPQLSYSPVVEIRGWWA
jgi:hypothetical protein